MAKGTRPQVGNVIYANFGNKTTVTEYSAVSNKPFPAVLTRAANELMNAVYLQTDSGRFQRGMKYAQAGNVLDVWVRDGALHGSVAGSQNEPFTATIIVPHRSAEELSEVTQLLAATRAGFTDAGRGELSDRVLEVLLWEDMRDLRFSCTCPDPTRVCKHIVAVAQQCAHACDADPTLVFQLRGLNLLTMQEEAMRRVNDVPDASRTQGRGFWAGDTLPELPRPTLSPVIESADSDLLHRALRSITYTSVEELRAVADVEEMFDFLTR